MYKIRERKGKTYEKLKRSPIKRHTQTETDSKYLDGHRRLSQSEESKRRL
jgi:hypothetical protein